MRGRYLLLLLAGCAGNVSDPLSLAPDTPYSTWKEREGSSLVSSKYCKILIPESFSTSALSLADLIDIALHNNPTTRQTWAQARAAAGNYGVAAGAFYPTISLSAFYFRQRAGFPSSGIPTDTPGDPTTISGEVGPLTQDQYFTEGGPDLLLSYTIFDFGQRSAAATAAREALSYADLTHNNQIQSVLEIVMGDYYNYTYQLSLQKANEADLKNAETVLDATNERFTLGLASLGDVAQARTQYFQSKITLTNQKQAVETAYAQLAVDLGLPANSNFAVQLLPEQCSSVDPLLESVDELVQTAQVQRQDFLAAQADLRSKNALRKQAERALYPVFSTEMATGQYWFQGGLAEPKPHWSASVSLSMPIFTGFANRNKIKTAKANEEYSEAVLYQTELAVIQSVTVAHANVKTASTNLNDTQEYLKSAELQFTIALANYRAGTNTLLDVVNAETNLADARAKKASAQKDWYTSLAQIAFATGSLCVKS